MVQIRIESQKSFLRGPARTDLLDNETSLLESRLNGRLAAGEILVPQRTFLRPVVSVRCTTDCLGVVPLAAVDEEVLRCLAEAVLVQKRVFDRVQSNSSMADRTPLDVMSFSICSPLVSRLPRPRASATAVGRALVDRVGWEGVPHPSDSYVLWTDVSAAAVSKAREVDRHRRHVGVVLGRVHEITEVGGPDAWGVALKLLDVDELSLNPVEARRAVS